MLGYRSLFDVDRADVIDSVHAQLHSWLRRKRYDADALALNGDVALIGANAEAVMTSEDLQDGSRSSLFALRESGDTNGAWISQVIAHEPAHGKSRPWVWIDIEQEGAQVRQAAIPNLARALLGVLDARDGGASLTATPTRVGLHEVSSLIEALESRTRRGPVFVAGSSDELPIGRWSEYVGRLLKDTVGLAAGYVLDAEATEALTERIGARHAAGPGSLRTYLPGLDPGSDLDALRHRFLTTETILRTAPGRIERTLGQRARDIALAAPIPRWAARVESRLLAETDSRVLGWKPTALVGTTAEVEFRATAPVVITAPALAQSVQAAATLEGAISAPPAHQGDGRATGEEPLTVEESSSSRTAPSDSPVQPTALAVLARSLFDADLDEALLTSLAAGQTALVQAQAEVVSLEASVDRLSRRSSQLNERVLSLEDVVTAGRTEADDAQLEWAQATDDVARLERTVRELQRRLARSATEEAWLPIPEAAGLEVAPDSFASLLVRLEEFTFISFTGDSGRTEALDTRQPYWATKAWLALLALEDYARGKKEGVVSVGVDQYLQQAPDGFATYPFNRHARDESEEVKNNPKFATARMLPVPTMVAPGGAIFMGAHFKIAQFGMVSPRLHYHDATAVDGRIYVGHLGAHLPTGATN